MPMQNEIFSGAFSHPVLSSQAVFRTVMEAMARPARIVSVKSDAAAPEPLCDAAAALALTLSDADTPLWLSPSLSASAAPAWLTFHTGAPMAQARLDAVFAFFARQDGWPKADGFSLGSDLYPDRSPTLVIEVEALTGGPMLVAEGPGIEALQRLSPKGLPPGFLEERALNRSFYPRGHDLILVCDSDLICLPRTTRLALREV